MQYKVILGSRVDSMLRRHILFISNVSISRAERFADEFEGIVKQVKSNPFLYPFDGDENLPPEKSSFLGRRKHSVHRRRL